MVRHRQRGRRDCPPPRVTHRPAQGADRRGGRAVRRQAIRVTDVQAAERHQHHGDVRVPRADLRQAGDDSDTVGDAGGDDHGYDGVDLSRGQHGFESGSHLLGCHRGSGVDRIRRPGRAVDETGQPSAQGGRELGHDQAEVLGGVGDEDAHPASVAEHCEAGSCRKWLLGEQQCCLSKVVGVDAPDDAGLGEERSDGDVRRGCRSGVGGAAALTRLRAPADDRQDRLALGEASGEAGELADVAERLEVQRRCGDAGIVVPRGQQVVAGDVSRVAERHEAADTEPEVPGAVQENDSDATRLAGDGQTTRRWWLLGVERGVQPDVGVVGQHPQAVGTHQPDPVGPGQHRQLPLERLPPWAQLAETRADHDRRAYPGRGRVFEGGGGRLGGHGNHGEVHRVGQVAERWVGRHIGHAIASGMYDDHLAGVPVGQDRPQHGRADAGPVAPHARDRHGLRGQEGGERPRLCLELPSVGCVLDPGGAGDAQVHGHDALIGMLA